MSQPVYVIDEMISAKSIAARIEDLAKEIKSTFSEESRTVRDVGEEPRDTPSCEIRCRSNARCKPLSGLDS